MAAAILPLQDIVQEQIHWTLQFGRTPMTKELKMALVNSRELATTNPLHIYHHLRGGSTAFV